ncbi:branched-chain amino acid transport system II carrier protein [Peribacillus frigoritolerans]|uniref:branched-chain amino acid transport system II carrier protein n=1 Tax=Peribacillus frigoritolerans TaxID=450367 RepID=UPI0035176030
MLSIGLLPLPCFLGAGNVIFAPMLGQQAGTNTWLARGGFLITSLGKITTPIFPTFF